MNALSSVTLRLASTIGASILLGAATGCKKETADIRPDPEIDLSPELPAFDIDYTKNRDDIQTQFDIGSWRTFVYVCSPSDGLQPINKGTITDQKDARSVFENYSFNYDLFHINPPGSSKRTPVGWGQPDALDKQRRERWSTSCPDLITQAEAKGITNMAALLALDEFIEASNDPRPHVPVIDQNQQYVRTGVVYGEIVYGWVIDNQLYIKDGVEAAESKATEQKVTQVVGGEVKTFSQKVNFLTAPNGAFQLKTSWKILGDGDDPSRFHTAWAAALFENSNFSEVGKVVPQCSLVRVGLVGMHITIKTDDQPNYIWSTFEHIDNCPEVGNIQDKHYSFYNNAADDSEIPNTPPEANQTVDGFKDPKWFNPEGALGKPSQVIREVPIPAGTQAVNRTYQQALSDTVWANYQLIGTQWTDPTSKEIIPPLLSNTTLETFDQTEASCIGCHNQVTPNTLKGTINDVQFTKYKNVLNLRLENPSLSSPPPAVAVYSDYMWSLFKWGYFESDGPDGDRPNGQLTSYQIRE